MKRSLLAGRTASVGVELEVFEAHDTAASSQSTLISAVRLATLTAQLERLSEAELLTLLASEESGLLEPIEASQCVLVSYRQEKGQPPFDSLTLDGSALRGILAAAAKLKANAVWLDAWCYRMPGPEYVHADFCRTLNGILGGVSGVVWLPRSTQGSLGEYGYRLWCTFEASFVHQRGLPVAIAGVGLSRFQHLVHAWGSFVPALRADGTLDQLARLNLSAYFFALAQMTFSVVALATGFANPQQFAVHFLLTFWCVPFWLASRSLLGQQIRLAKNAKSVYQIMSEATTRWQVTQPPQLDDVHGSEAAARSLLLRELAWLPAHDRRDVLVVHSLLASLPRGARLGVDGIRALALSAHTAARMRPSAGDRTAVSLSLRAWLAERDAAADALGSSGNGDASHATWLDGVGDVRATSPSDCLPLPELMQLSWTFVRGTAQTPLGALELGAPRLTRWALAPSKDLVRPQVTFAAIGFLASNGLEDVGSSLLMPLVHNAVISRSTNEIIDSVLYFVQWPFLALLLWERVRDFASSALAGRIPLPLVCFNGALGNLAVAALAAGQTAGTAYLLRDAVNNWLDGTPSMGHEFSPSRVQDLSEVIVYGILVCIFLFEALLALLAAARVSSAGETFA